MGTPRCRSSAGPAGPDRDLCDSVLETLCPEPAADDATLLLARPRLFGEDHVATWDVPRDPAAGAGVRRRAADTLSAWGLDEAAFVT